MAKLLFQINRYLKDYLGSICLIIIFIIITLNLNSFLSLYYRYKYKDCISFDSSFESGSLKNAELLNASRINLDNDASWFLSYEIRPNSDPKMINDSIAPSPRWFYFRMTGVKNKYIQLNFKETDPTHPVYSYDNSKFYHFTEKESAFRLIQKRFIKDTVFIAYSIPYTVTRLHKKIKEWKSESNLVHIDTIGLSNNSNPLITVSFSNIRCKYSVYIQARVHPSETPSSWLIEAMIDALLSNTNISRKLLENINFYFLPISNPDGVINGLSRSNTNGIDIESNFSSKYNIQKETSSILTFYNKLNTGKELDLILNLHSQVTPHLSFWLHDSISTSKEYYNKQLKLENLVAKYNSLYFKSRNYIKGLPSTTIEKISWDNKLGKTLSLTLETPYTFFMTQDYSKEWLTIDNIGLTGELLLKSIAEYLGVNIYNNTLDESEDYKNTNKLINSYPGIIIDYKNDSLILKDNIKLRYDDKEEKMHYELLYNPCIKDIFKLRYNKNNSYINNDAGRYRNEKLFKYIYGNNKEDVEKNLTEIIWCPSIINKRIKVTSVNNVHKAFDSVSRELDLYPQWLEYLIPAGTYNWRPIADSDRLSSHSYGIAIDLNTKFSNYWKWDYPMSTEYSKVPYKNNIPIEIINIFEKHGFIWGGRWSHYDTMHFEYRPELLID